MADTYDLMTLLDQLQDSGRPYFQFLAQGSMSVGIYHLAGGEPDRQEPHTEDEIYYVLSGAGKVEIDGRVSAIGPGSVVWVGRGTPHHFFDYPEGLTVLVVFAPEHHAG